MAIHLLAKSGNTYLIGTKLAPLESAQKADLDEGSVYPARPIDQWMRFGQVDWEPCEDDPALMEKISQLPGYEDGSEESDLSSMSHAELFAVSRKLAGEG